MHAVLERLFDLPADERTPAAAQALLGPQWSALVEEEPELAAMIADDDASSPRTAGSVTRRR